MHRLWLRWSAVTAALLVVLPAVIARGCGPAAPSGQLSEPSAAPSALRDTANDLPVAVHFPDTGKVVTLALSDYLVGVGAGELDPSFAEEAVKAFMVAARTYTIRRMRQFGGGGCELNPQADICASPEHGQAYLSPAQLEMKLGAAAAQRFQARLQAAERATRGLIVTYEGEPIDAIYHSTSGRQTEDPEAVWGRAVPYLQPVPDPWGRSAPHYTVTRSFTLEALGRALGTGNLGLPAATGGTPVQVTDRTPGGRVAAVRVGEQRFSGTEFRRLLGLRSTDFDLAWENGRLEVTTHGYGHGVGLSQWGAHGMARSGANFRQILAHYYPGTRVEPLFGE